VVLQAWFAWKLLGKLEDTRAFWVRSLAMGLFVFAPPLMIRVSGHSALVGQWMILAALYLYLCQERWTYRVAWPALVLLSTLVHSYLFVMVMAIWLASMLKRIALRLTPPLSCALDAGSVPALALLGLWQAGFFMVSVGPAGGYGEYGTNLLSLANPDIYSHVIRPLASPLLGFHEGFAFMGLGALLLIPMVVPVVLARPRVVAIEKGHWPLIVVLAALTLFAITHHVGVGTTGFRIPLPEALERSASVLRSSGRMFWPTFYVLLTGLIVLTVRSHGTRVASWLLAGALLVQVIDTSEGWHKHYVHFRDTRASTWRTPLQSDFWRVVGAEYKKLRHVPLEHHASDYAIWADFAASHGMATDSTYLARVDPERLRAAQAANEGAIELGEFERDTLYVLDRKHATKAASSLDADNDLLTRVDGVFLLAPGWKARGRATPASEPELTERDFDTGPALDHAAFLGAGGDGLAYLAGGWSAPESWGVWAEEPTARLRIPLDTRVPLPASIHLEAGALVAEKHPSQAVDCIINDETAALLQFSLASNTGWRHIAIPPAALRKAKDSGVLTVTFRMQNAGVPKQIGLNDDTRKLGIALHRLKLSGKP
jgi:hypothetical protein